MIDKKTISPLNLTMVLISFAIVFGILIKYIIPIPTTLFSSCSSDVNINLVSISEEELLCSDSKSLQFTIENGVTTEIESLIVVINDQPQEISEKIGKAETYVANIAFQGPINNLKIIPKIKINQEFTICDSESIKRENIKQC
jgi:hypothetical protein